MIIIFQHKIKLENGVITELLKLNQKRGLYVYLYALRAANERKFAWIHLKELLNLLGLKNNNSNKKALIEAIKTLEQMELVKVYNSFDCNELVNWEEINVNEMFYIEVNPVEVEENYTLIDDSVIDNITFNKTLSDNEDCLAIVALISRMIERREGIYQVCYPKLDSMIKELKIAKSRCIDLLKELVEQNIIGCVKVKLKSEDGKEAKEHNIYSLAADIQDLEEFSKVVTKENRLGQDLKIIPRKSLLKDGRLVDGQLQHVWINDDGEYDYSIEASDIIKVLTKRGCDFKDINNEYFYSHLNNWCQNYDYKSLREYIFYKTYEDGISNLIGYFIKMIPNDMPNYTTLAS